MIKDNKVSKFQKLCSIPKSEIVTIYKQTNSLQGILERFNIKRDPRCTTYLNAVLMEFGITKNPSVRYNMNLRKEEIIELAKTAPSVLSILQGLKITTIRRGMYPAVRAILDANNITLPKRFTWENHLVYCTNSLFPRSHLARKVRQDNWMEYTCVLCGLGNLWNNKPLNLQLDHINGVNNDHRKENLRWVCPNCHSQTETFCTSCR